MLCMQCEKRFAKKGNIKKLKYSILCIIKIILKRSEKFLQTKIIINSEILICTTSEIYLI